VLRFQVPERESVLTRTDRRRVHDMIAAAKLRQNQLRSRLQALEVHDISDDPQGRPPSAVFQLRGHGGRSRILVQECHADSFISESRRDGPPNPTRTAYDDG